MKRPRALRYLTSASAVAVLASLLVVGPAAAHACATHPVNVRLAGFANGPQDVPHYYWGIESQQQVGILFNAFGHDCSGVDTSLKWSTVAGSATAPGDFTAVSEKPEFVEAINDTSETFTEGFVDLNADTATEDAVQTFKVRIDSSPHGTLNHGFPIEAPVHLVDDDGASRVGLAAGPAATIKELDGHFALNPDVRIPVFRAGPGTGQVVVSYTVSPDDGVTDVTGSHDTPSEADDTPGSLTIEAGARHDTIDLSIVRDDDGTDENLAIQLTGATNATLAETTSNSVAIDDNYVPNSDDTPPATSFHHPKHNKVYKSNHPNARTIHVFAPTQAVEPAGVDWARTALRRTKKNGSCQWWNGGGWSPGGCTDTAAKQHWLPTRWLGEGSWSATKDIYEYPTNLGLLKPLKPSVGTKIKNYFVYGWARDNLGNEENVFQMGRNKNRFEVTKV